MEEPRSDPDLTTGLPSSGVPGTLGEGEARVKSTIDEAVDVAPAAPDPQSRMPSRI